MRVVLALVLILAVGCVTPEPDAFAPDTNVTDPTAPGAVVTQPGAPVPAMGEREPVTTEHFVFTPDHTLDVVEAGAAPLPESLVPEPLKATAFYESFASGLTLAPWQGPPSRSAWESTADIDVTVNFIVTAPATGTNPSAAGFPPVGGWIGSAERFAFFVLATDAPASLEANKMYTVHLVAKPPAGGFFLREGESLAIHTFLSYQTADGSPPSYVVGGLNPSGFKLIHEHFDLTAPTATVVLDEVGELGPNPGISGDMQQTPVDVPFKIPADALYVVAHVTGAPKAGPRTDVDLSLRTSGGEAIASGTGPTASEMVVLGPGNLAAFGRDLVAHMTNSGAPAGSTYTLTITAYGP